MEGRAESRRKRESLGRPAVPIAVETAPSERMRAVLWHMLNRRRSVLVSFLIVFGVIFCAVGAPWVSPHDPIAQELSRRNTPPFGFAGAMVQHPLGTDPLGRDVLSRLIYGARVSLIVGFSAVILQGAIGMGAGLLAGYYGGWVDNLVMRLVDIQLGVPFLVLAITVAVVLGGGLTNIVMVLTVTGWVFYARVTRGQVLSLRNSDFVLAAHVVGSSASRIMMRHLLPNVFGAWLVLATFQVARMIIAESSLSFLGVGIQPPTPSWGGMVADGRDYLGTAWWVATLPGLAIAATSLGVHVIGDWLRDVLDPTIQLS